MRLLVFLGGGLVLALAVWLTLWPTADLAASGFFYDPNFYAWRGDFIWRVAPIPMFFHDLVRFMGWFFGVTLSLALIYTAARKTTLLRLSAKAYFFLVVSLLAGPALLTNALLKEHWDRARPRQIEQFGGTAQYSPPLKIVLECQSNCSFVSGDASLAFWLHSFAYVVRRKKLVLAATMAFGAGIGLLRIGMGAHFLSDVFFAALFMALTSAATYWLVYKRRKNVLPADPTHSA